MTNSDPTPDTQACGGDVAAYALGALDASEATAFRAHLAECIVCRDELMAFQNVVDLLPITTTQHRAPRALRGRVLTGIQNTPEPELSRDRPWRGWRLSSASRLARPALALGGAVAVLVVRLSRKPARLPRHAQDEGLRCDCDRIHGYRSNQGGRWPNRADRAPCPPAPGRPGL
jgi:anti-sigma factor RsiW